MKKYVFAAMLALCAMLTLLPTAAMALNTGSIQREANGIEDPDGDDVPTVYNYVYFGKNGETPIKWRVLDDETNMMGTGLFLLSDGFLSMQTHTFRDLTHGQAPADITSYQASDLRKILETNEDSIRKTVFSGSEQGAMLATTKTDDAYDGRYGEDDYRNYKVPECAGILSGDKLFLLSAEEAENDYYFPNRNADRGGANGNGENDWSWWLRSPIGNVEGIENAVGRIAYEGEPSSHNTTVPLYLRPAFNLNTIKVLMISDAEGGKPAGAVSSTLDTVNTYTPTEWKLTLRDQDRIFFPYFESASGNELTIRYIDATTGDNEYISAIIEDDESHDITHYGRVLSLPKGSEDGRVTIKLPDDMAGKTLYVFNEQCNGDKMTDYASSIVSIEYCAIAANPTQLNFGRAYAGGTRPDAQTVTLTNTSKESVTIDLPTLDGYSIEAGSGFNGDSATLDMGETATFTVQPQASLGAGAHDGTIKVRGSNSVSASISATFLVSEPIDAIQSTDNAIKTPDGGATPSAYSRVYFGMDGNTPILWRALGKTKTNTGIEPETDKSILLLSEGYIKDGGYPFEKNGNDNAYSSSDLRGALQTNADSVLNTAFSNPERNAILPATNVSYVPDGDQLFPLSYDEANSDKYFPHGNTDRAKRVGTKTWWWLRTPAGFPYANFVRNDGLILMDNTGMPSSLRPALNLDAAKVAFVSAAVGGKEADGMDGGLAAIGKNKTDSWKLTLFDSNRSMYVGIGSVSGNVLSVGYTRAKAGANEYISAIILDASGDITHYGRICSLPDDTHKNGTATINLPEDMSGKLLFLFSEQYNGDKMTDYVGTFYPVNYYAIKATPETLDFGSAYTGYTQPAAQTVTIENTCRGRFSIDLPTLENFTVTAGEGFSEGKATLSAGETATFTVRPNTGLGAGTYDSTLTVSGSSGASDTVDLRFAVVQSSAIAITVQPADQYVVEGQQARFAISATGEGLGYQWYINRNNGRGWRELDGATTPSYTSSPVDLDCDGFRYACRVRDAQGQTLDSEIATLHVSRAVIPPETGDDSKPLLWLSLCLLGCAGLLALAVQKWRRA